MFTYDTEAQAILCKYARPKGKRKIFRQTRQGLTLRQREEHGNTFASEIEPLIGYNGIPLNVEEIMKQAGKIPFTHP